MPTTIDELKILLALHGLKCVRMWDDIYLVRDGQFYSPPALSWKPDILPDENTEVEIDFYPTVRSWLADGMPI